MVGHCRTIGMTSCNQRLIFLVAHPAIHPQYSRPRLWAWLRLLPMKFRYIKEYSSLPKEAKDVVYLIDDRWDDWGKFRTMFTVVIFDHHRERHEPGSIKIASKGLAPSNTIGPGTRAPEIPSSFDELGLEYFSLGQSEDYYQVLSTLSADIRKEIFVALRDCAYDLSIFKRFGEEPAMNDSLLRGIAEKTVRNRFHRLARGRGGLSELIFDYQLPGNKGAAEPPTIGFEVSPETTPPTNVHVLIGRNGVGKTRCMHGMIRAILSKTPKPAEHGHIEIHKSRNNEWSFSGLVGVMFSAFDRFTPPKRIRQGMRADFIGPGLRLGPKDDQDEAVQRLAPEFFTSAFVDTIRECRRGPKRDRLMKALESLESDPLFEEADVKQLLEPSEEMWYAKAVVLFNRLSSGHAIVLLTVSRLVAIVEEATIVLIDEPEAHLHPPLLSALIRTVSELLSERNGIAVIATHSPVVLQEVPSSCVWVLSRTGLIAKAERPPAETFGENVGILTRAVFDLEVTESGFHRLLKKAIESARESADPYETVLEQFGGQLGLEGRSILRSLLAIREPKK